MLKTIQLPFKLSGIQFLKPKKLALRNRKMTKIVENPEKISRSTSLYYINIADKMPEKSRH